MRLTRGLGGQVLLASDLLHFSREELTDVGDGFDWRIADPSKRLWLECEDLVFEASYLGGDWEVVPALEVSHLTGRVGFGRCLRAHHVRAMGVCRPLALLGTAEAWELRVEVAVADTTSFGDDSETVGSKRERAAVAELSGCVLDDFLAGDLDRSDLLVLLPFRTGVWAGVGAREASPDTSNVRVNLHEGSVSYVRC